jgi:hypothetical protein
MPKFEKGSDEMKKHMEKLRSLRKSKSSKHIEEKSDTSSTVDESPMKENSEGAFVGTGKRTNSWIKHVQAFAKANNINYFEALKSPKVKEGYKK